jgi:hypothetical protein
MGYISQLGQQVFNKTFLDPISKNEIKRKRKKGKKNERKKKVLFRISLRPSASLAFVWVCVHR